MEIEDKDTKINLSLTKVAPELDSEFAKYPLARKFWLTTNAAVPKEDGTSEPAFIPYKKDPNFPASLKKDYVYGAGPKGWGYYHLLTRASYIALNARVRNNGPPSQGCCCFPPPVASNHQFSVDDYDVASNIIYNRSVVSIPDDFLAYKEAIAIARGEAQVDYQMSQDVQLILMLVT